MGLDSDIRLNASKFSPHSITDHTKDFNAQLIKIGEGGPKWWEVGAEKYRQMRWNGETPFPAPIVLNSGKDDHVQSRDKDRKIPIRVFEPEQGNSRGGGWVLMSEKSHDVLLKFIADKSQCTVVSVGYRLAPEHPFPAGPNDCYDVAEHLVDNAKSKYGGELLFVGGESAGGHLSMLVTLHLLKHRPSFSFKGIVPHYGCFELSSFLPQAHLFEPHGYDASTTLVLDHEIMTHYMEAFLPNTTEKQRRDPSVSPLYADLRKIAAGSKGGLPPALFLCGSEDVLLDDTVLMSSRWMMAGGEAVVRITPGGCHGYTLMPHSYDDSKEANEDMIEFMLEKLK